MCVVRVCYSVHGGMFYPAMKWNRVLRAACVLLFALTLPLQGFGAMSPCAHPYAAPTHAADAHSDGHLLQHDAASHAPNTHCAKATATPHHLHCGDHCCGVAIALTPESWMAPRSSAPEIFAILFCSSPAASLDRLDRPPRFV